MQESNRLFLHLAADCVCREDVSLLLQNLTVLQEIPSCSVKMVVHRIRPAISLSNPFVSHRHSTLTEIWFVRRQEPKGGSEKSYLISKFDVGL